jgi:hypothetical protein
MMDLKSIILLFIQASYNTWHHIALSYDGAYIRLFIDNVLVSTVAASGELRLLREN